MLICVDIPKCCYANANLLKYLDFFFWPSLFGVVFTAVFTSMVFIKTLILSASQFTGSSSF